MPASDVLRPGSNGVVVTPPDSFLAAYRSSRGVTRMFCKRCGTNVSCSRYPMPEGWPETLDILMGTIDREDLEREELRPERHIFWDKGIGWVKSLFSEGDDGMPKHPLANLTDFVTELYGIWL